MLVSENPKPTTAELHLLHQKHVAEQVFCTQQLLGTVPMGSKSIEEIETNLRDCQRKSYALAMEIVGPPWQGLVIGPEGTRIVDSRSPDWAMPGVIGAGQFVCESFNWYYAATMICIVACGSEKVKYIETILSELNKEFETILIDDVEKVNFEIYSGIIISGSPILLIEDTNNHYVNQFNFLKTYERPVLGICFGHQVLGLVYGASITIGESIKGLEEVNLLGKSELFDGIPTMSTFDQNHREHITAPDDFRLLATSSSCANEAMQHAGKSLYGVQFHPETSGVIGKKLIENFVSLCE